MSYTFEIYKILVEECGARDTSRKYYDFHFAMCQGTREYRFIGNLGFGGKLRNPYGRLPSREPLYVDYYKEDINEERQKAVEKANNRLKNMGHIELFQVMEDHLYKHPIT
jgi:hypothetical protein